MSIRSARAGLWGLAAALVPINPGFTHEIVGNRFFPATLGIDDPGVNDELSLPTVDSFKTGDNPPNSAARYFRGVFQAHHRGFRGVVCVDLQLSEPDGSNGNGSERLPESRNHLQISTIPGPCA